MNSSHNNDTRGATKDRLGNPAPQHLQCGTPVACQNIPLTVVLSPLQGAVTVFALAIPSVFSLLVLLRNEAARGIESTKLEWVRARVKEQCELLEAGQPLTFPLDALLVHFCPLPYSTLLHSVLCCSTMLLILELLNPLPLLGMFLSPIALLYQDTFLVHSPSVHCMQICDHHSCDYRGHTCTCSIALVLLQDFVASLLPPFISTSHTTLLCYCMTFTCLMAGTGQCAEAGGVRERGQPGSGQPMQAGSCQAGLQCSCCAWHRGDPGWTVSSHIHCYIAAGCCF